MFNVNLCGKPITKGLVIIDFNEKDVEVVNNDGSYETYDISNVDADIDIGNYYKLDDTNTLYVLKNTSFLRLKKEYELLKCKYDTLLDDCVEMYHKAITRDKK